jgi:glycolate oxidase subunit GlcD
VKSSLCPQALSELKKIFGKKRLLIKEDKTAYSYDASVKGVFPGAVVLPECKDEVIEVMKLAQKFKFPVTCRGAGTSTTGSSLSHHSGLVLCFSKMNRILELNREERIVKVEPGVVNKQLKEFLKPYGLFYPPDPASYAFSTIGGNVATGAGGPKGLKYGTTKDYVLDIEVVLPGGKVFHTGRAVLKQAVNYNLTALMVGSEGTLGVFTEITLKLLPLPEKRVLFLSFHAKEAEALELISHFLIQGITPCSAEFVDFTTLKALSQLEKNIELRPEKVKSLLFLELDGKKEEVAKDASLVENELKRLGIKFVKAETETEIEELWEIRRKISPAGRLLGAFKIADDVVVPRRYMADLLKVVRQTEAEAHLPILCFGHAGDGNFHINILFNKEEEERAYKAREKILQEVWRLGGTFSGEHGVGYTRKFFVKKELSPVEIELMKGIKKLFDPLNLLNPGIKIP